VRRGEAVWRARRGDVEEKGEELRGGVRGGEGRGAGEVR
jgi:hypothetical protein